MKAKLMLAALLTGLLPAAALAAGSGGGPRKILYTYAGTLAASPSTTSVTLDVENGTRAALRTLLGQSDRQTFSFDSSTEFLRWANGVPTVVPPSALAPGDWVRVNVRAPRGSSLAAIESTAPGIVGDHGARPQPPDKPLFLFRGTLTAVGPATVTMNVAGGNRRALRLLIGQAAAQSFAYDSRTIVLLWQGKVPTVISAAQLEIGDRLVVRVRADRGSSLVQVEATPAAHLGDREPPAKQM
jgi:hypothetical protein